MQIGWCLVARVSGKMKKSPLPLQNACGGSKNQSLGKEALVKLLRWHFGHPEFRGKQLDAIEAVLSGILYLHFLHAWTISLFLPV